MIFLGISLTLFAIIAAILVREEVARRRRIKVLAEMFGLRSALSNLRYKRDLITGKLNLDPWEYDIQISALNMALDWQRESSTADVPTTPQDWRGI